MKSLRNKAYQLLRRSEAFFKTDMVYLAKGGFWLSGTQFAGAFISFLLSIAFANFLSQGEYGTYKYILSLGGILGVLSLSGLGKAVSRSVAQGYEGEFLKSTKYNVQWGTLLFLVGSIGSIYYYIHNNYGFALGLFIVSIFTPILDTTEMYSSYLVGKKDFRSVGIYSFLRIVISAAVMFMTLLITSNPIILILSYFLTHSVVTAIFFGIVVKTRKPNQLTNNETITLAKHTSVINNISGLVDQLDNILVFHLLGPAPLAIYNFSLAIPEYLSGVIKSLGTLALPKFSDSPKERIRGVLMYKSFQVFILGSFMTLIYILFSPLFFHFVFPKYIESIKYSQVYSLILMTSAVIPLTFLESQLAIRVKYKLSTVTNIIKLISLILGVTFWGLWGLIFAKIFSKIVGLIYIFILVREV